MLLLRGPFFCKEATKAEFHSTRWYCLPISVNQEEFFQRYCFIKVPPLCTCTCCSASGKPFYWAVYDDIFQVNGPRWSHESGSLAWVTSLSDELNFICHNITQFPSWFLSPSSFLQGNIFFYSNVICKNLPAWCEFHPSFFLLLSSHSIWNSWSLYTCLGQSHLINNRGRHLQYCMSINIKVPSWDIYVLQVSLDLVS